MACDRNDALEILKQEARDEVDEAARAMLAALEAIATHKPTHFPRDDIARIVRTARAAIAAATAAGITTGEPQ